MNNAQRTTHGGDNGQVTGVSGQAPIAPFRFIASCSSLQNARCKRALQDSMLHGKA